MGPRQSMQLEGSGQRFPANRVALIQGQGAEWRLEPHSCLPVTSYADARSLVSTPSDSLSAAEACGGFGFIFSWALGPNSYIDGRPGLYFLSSVPADNSYAMTKTLVRRFGGRSKQHSIPNLVSYTTTIISQCSTNNAWKIRRITPHLVSGI